MRFFFFAASFSQITTAHHVVIRLWAQTQKQRHLSCFDITKKLPRRAPRQFLCASRRIDTPPGAAAVLEREFGYTVNRETTGIEKRNWEAGKRRYLAMGYGILLKSGNVEIERIAPQETQPEQVTQPERETQPEQVTQPERETQPEEVTQLEERNREDRNDHVRARSYGQLRRD